MLAYSNGAQIVLAIQNSKEKARTSGAGNYPPELETYCIKLKVAVTIMEDLTKEIDKFLKEIEGSISILKSMDDIDELEAKLLTVKTFISCVADSYKSELKIKCHVLSEEPNIYN